MNTDKIFHYIHKASKECNVPVYLVGGCIRDLLLYRPVSDIDILAFSSLKFLKILHTYLGGKLICLDSSRQIFRIVLSKHITIDVTCQVKQTLLENLASRDFTINAMAIPIRDIIEGKQIHTSIIDPFKGREDLKNGLINITNLNTFKEDPLHLIRAYRMAAQLSFQISSQTHCIINQNRKSINSCAKEHIREEWFKLLSVPMSLSYIRKMQESSLLEEIFPEIPAMKKFLIQINPPCSLLDHSLTTLFYFEKIIDDPAGFFNHTSDAILIEKIQQWKNISKKNIECLKMGALFHDIALPLVTISGKKSSRNRTNHEQVGAILIAKRMKHLRFSSLETTTITDLIARHHLRSLFFFQNTAISKRLTTNFFIHFNNNWFDFLLLFLADNLAKAKKDKESRMAIEFIKTILKHRYKMELRLKKGSLIDGNDLKKSLNCPQGPLMGQILKEIKELTLCVNIDTKKEALALAQNLLETK